MKKMLSIIAILICGFSYGQNEIEKSNDKIKLISTHWITSKCSDLENQYENNLCIRRELYRFTQKKINWSLIHKLQKDNYKIQLTLRVEKNGEISKVTANSEYEKLNKEIERIFMKFQDRIKLVDKNGKRYEGNFVVPITFKGE